jgi:hypothetical protein
MSEQMDKIISAEHLLDDARNLVECMFLATKDLGGIADPFKTASSIAGGKIGEAIALLDEYLKASGARPGADREAA